jgi:hypothetical protein
MLEVVGTLEVVELGEELAAVALDTMPLLAKQFEERSHAVSV